MPSQNLDHLHQAAGSQEVVDLHGRLDRVRCRLACEHRLPRADFQDLLVDSNAWAELDAVEAPDGDMDLQDQDFSGFLVPPRPACGGMLTPDVVLFGETYRRSASQRHPGHLIRLMRCCWWALH